MTDITPDRTTVPDCHLNGRPVLLKDWASLSSDQLATIVGCQNPGDSIIYAHDYTWTVQRLLVADLQHSTWDGEIPTGGWAAAYTRHCRSDEEAIRNGSPEYHGRPQWLETWVQQSDIYPLYVIVDEDGYRLLDGHHRLAGAFWHQVTHVWALVGRSPTS